MESSTGDVRDRVAEIRGEIAAAAARSGRRAEDITLVAVSKTFDAAAIRRAHAAGLRDFGENRVQELAAKAPLVADLDLRFHLIGHLQTNKVRTVLPLMHCLHSLDRAALAEEIARRIGPGRILPVFLQVRTTEEETKSGVTPAECASLLEVVRHQGCFDLRGLMTIGPLEGTEDDNRRAFASLRRLRDDLAARYELPLPWLSMGMSGDFVTAIEEGATHVRIGSRIFGARVAR